MSRYSTAPQASTHNDNAAGLAKQTEYHVVKRILATLMAATCAFGAHAQSSTTEVFYILADQINTAREITDAAGVKVWESDAEPFGANPPNENPAGRGRFVYNPRFPGQYFDRETGLHYNYYRDYDPQTGRYVQSDPIGLEGGLNTFAYVAGNPISNTDSTGLLLDPVTAASIAALEGGAAGITGAAGMSVGAFVGTVGLSASAGIGVGLGINYAVEHTTDGSIGTHIHDFLNPELSERSKERARRKSASVAAANVIARAQGRNRADPADDDCDKQEKKDEQACSRLPAGGARRACYARAAVDAAACRDRKRCK